MKYSVLLLLLLFTLSACDSQKASGPEEVKWDRDSCEYCQMMISDRYHVAEVRGGRDRRIHKFDDIGGAILWLQEQAWKDNPDTEIWVADHHSGKWLNAQKAWFVVAEQTPMNYGFSAEATKSEGAINYQQMRAAILKQNSKRQ